MKKIIAIEDEYNVEPVDAIIENDYIIPGLNGKKVDEISTYYNLTSSKTFNENLLVFKEETPNVSITNYKDKIINHGNKLKNSVSLIINNKLIKDYCNKSSITYNDANTDNICLHDLFTCKSNTYKIEATYELTNESLFYIDISSGDIILINDELSLDIFKYFLRNIAYRNLKIVDIEYLISEVS